MTELYRKEALIGTGAMASVYRGWDEKLKRQVAIKELSHTYRDNSEFKRIFLEEARKMAAIRHANVISIDAVDESHETPWLIMELADGGTLADRLEQGSVQAAEAELILRQLVEGLSEIHNAGLVHRDIKPQNLLQRQGIYKIGDFGIAKDEGSDERTIPFVTVKYASPEALSQPERVGPASDIYSLGFVMYEQILGPEHFSRVLSGLMDAGEDGASGVEGESARAVRDGGKDAESPGDQGSSIMSEQASWIGWHLGGRDLPPLHELDSSVSEALSLVLSKMTRKSLGDRYSSGGEVLADLEKLDPPKGPVTEVWQPPDSQQAESIPVRKRSRGLIIAAGVSLTVFLLLVIMLMIPTDLELDITSEPPGAAVLQDDVEVGVTPMEGHLTRPGEGLVFRKQGFEELEREVVEGESSVHVQLVPLSFEVTITTEPTRAAVMREGERIGETPLTGERLPLGTELQLVKEGFETASLVVDDGSEGGRIHFDLIPLRVRGAAELAARVADRLTSAWEARLELLAGGQIFDRGRIRLPGQTPIAFRVTSERPCHVVLFHIAADGALTVLDPTAAGPHSRVAAGTTTPLASGLDLTAEPPYGHEWAFLVATGSDFSIPEIAGTVSIPGGARQYRLGSGDPESPAVRFVDWLTEDLPAADPAGLAWTHLELEVYPPEG